MNKVESDFLRKYNPNDYKRPSVTCDIIICTIKDDKLKVLLIKRKHPPYQDFWALPGGFVDIDSKETLKETAKRELKEETGLSDIFIEQLKTYGDPDRDPRMRVITVAYYALVPEELIKTKEIVAGDDAKETKWFSLTKPPDNLAFDHKKVLQDTLKRLQGKILYAPIVFKLAPEKFTLAELQSIYEAVLGRKLLASNFQRKIKSDYKIQKLKLSERGGLGRPGVFYTFKDEKNKL